MKSFGNVVQQLHSADQHGAGRVEQTGLHVPNIERLSALDGLATDMQTFYLDSPPGLLQTPTYGVISVQRAYPDLPKAEAQRWALMKSARTEAFLERVTAGELTASFVVGELALYQLRLFDPTTHERPVFESQIKRLIEIAALPNVSVQVLCSYDVTPNSASSFTGWTFKPETSAQRRVWVGYCEGVFGGSYSTRLDDHARLTEAFANMVTRALTPSGTLEHLTEALEFGEF